MVWLTCIVCGKEFNRKPYLVRRSGGRFCSNACHYASVRTGRYVQCAWCGAQVYRKAQHLRRSKNKKNFCDKSCQTLWRNQEFSGQRHNNWKNGEASYRNIMRRASIDPVCVFCSSNDERVIVVHHKDRNRKNNVLENLVWLCRNCHYIVHQYPVGREKGLIV